MCVTHSKGTKLNCINFVYSFQILPDNVDFRSENVKQCRNSVRAIAELVLGSYKLTMENLIS